MADLGNSTIFSQTDGSNNSGTMPSWSGSAAPSTLDDAGRALQGAVTREWNWRNYTITAAGTADAKTLTYATAPAAYYNGQRFAFIANTTNATTTPTLNVNSLGAVTIKKVSAGTLVALAAGDLVAGAFIEVAYNTSNTCFVWVNQSGDVYKGVSNTFTANQGFGVSATCPVDVLGDIQTTTQVKFSGLANFAIAKDIGTGNPGLNFDNNDYMDYDRTNNILRFVIGGSQKLAVSTSGVTGAGGMTLINTLTTTSGTTQTFSGLSLGSYRKIFIAFNGISCTSGTNTLTVGGATTAAAFANASTVSGSVEIELIAGLGNWLLKGGATTELTVGAQFNITTATTSFNITWAGSNAFDAGSISLYGVS
jgi:hypothetical protein